MKKFFGIIVIATLSLYACDKIEAPFKEVSTTPIDTTTTEEKVERKVLIEEYTGHQCGNCPEGALLLEDLKATYGEKLITLSIHTGFFAKLNNGSGYGYDFRNATGNELGAKYDIDNTGNPCATIGRTQQKLFTKTQWAEKISEQLIDNPAMNVSVAEAKLNTSTGKIEAKIKLKYFAEGLLTDNLVVYLIEDSIIAKQKWYGHNPEDVTNYVHKHVLRGSFNGTYGEAISASVIPVKGDEITKSVSITVNAKWNSKHLSVVAFVADANTDYIKNAAEAHVK